MMDAVLRILLRCSHRHITRPITPLDHAGVARSGTYVVCLDCGAQVGYDWPTMQLIRRKRLPKATEVLHPELAKQTTRHD
jgi:hypothetical protein